MLHELARSHAVAPLPAPAPAPATPEFLREQACAIAQAAYGQRVTSVPQLLALFAQVNARHASAFDLFAKADALEDAAVTRATFSPLIDAYFADARGLQARLVAVDAFWAKWKRDNATGNLPLHHFTAARDLDEERRLFLGTGRAARLDRLADKFKSTIAPMEPPANPDPDPNPNAPHPHQRLGDFHFKDIFKILYEMQMRL